MAEAQEMGAMALFGEKYGDNVRVIKFGESIELCGGCHVNRTGEIGFFKIKSEGSVASGIRRVEAITGEASEKFIFDELDTLVEIKGLLKSPKDPMKSISGLMADQQVLLKQIEIFQKEKTSGLKSVLISKIEVINGINFISAQVDLDGASIKDLSFQLRKEHSPMFLVLGSAQKNKATVSVALSDELVKEGRFNSSTIIRELASFIQGGGGGQAFFATAGGKKPEGIQEALNRAREILSQS